jgi:hypothetical protein
MGIKMNPTRSPLNEVQIIELLNIAGVKLKPYHIELLKRLVGEHGYMKLQLKDGRY